MIYRSAQLLFVIVSLSVLPSATSLWAEEPPGFEAEIAPLLIRRCVECHQGQNPSGSLLLTTGKGLMKGGDTGSVVTLNAPRDSYLLERIHDGDMPPDEKGQPQNLPASEIKLLERWIAAGAKWPEGRTLDLFERTNEVRGGRDWWSLQSVNRPIVPKLKSLTQPANPIDAFIFARLENHQMVPAPAANKRVLLRRLYFDLVGLPPTQLQIEEFENNSSPDALEQVIDELLASPQYGERWGRFWLDVVRYADTSGYERDQEKPFAWKYRDWVVKALNSDMPFDRFIIEQLAGDEIPNRNEQSVIATGFLRLGTWNDEPNDPLDYQYDRLEDLVHTTSSAFLGMTVKCARCHSHKFDPITHEDYYRMASAFWAGPISARDRKLLGGPNVDELGFSEVLGWTDLGRNPSALHVQKNGEREQPLQAVTPASLSMIPKLERPFDSPPESSKTTHRRLHLARWIANPENPLTARVFVNRLWLHHFGKGIVRTPNNLGFLADPPTHPQLLDWLASELVSGEWKIKRMHKLILTSRTWQQSSQHHQFSDYNERDSGNRLWWRAERRRLDAEALRDSLLATTGELDLRVGGPGFRTTISAEALEGLSMKSAAWKASSPQEQARRSLYLFSKRGLLPPMMTTFNFVDATQSCGQRDITTVPTQSLVLMNNPFVHARSAALARNIRAKTDVPQQQVRELWSAVYGRQPSEQEMQMATQHLSVQSKRFEQVRSQQKVQRKQQLKESLVLHLRADQGLTLDSAGHVSHWKDLSGHNHHATQAEPERQPHLNKTGFIKSASVSFDGKGRYLHLQGHLLDEQECTIIAVVTDRGPAGNRTLISNWNGGVGNSGTSLFLGMTADSTVRFSDAFANAGQTEDRRKPFVLTAVNGKGGTLVFQNSRELSSRTSLLPTRNLSTDWVIGQQGNINGEFWNGDLAELRVFKRALSADERATVEEELLKQYSIPTVAHPTTPQQTPQALALASLAHVLLNSNEFLYVD